MSGFVRTKPLEVVETHFNIESCEAIRKLWHRNPVVVFTLFFGFGHRNQSFVFIVLNPCYVKNDVSVPQRPRELLFAIHHSLTISHFFLPFQIIEFRHEFV
jgi:hypothetical protein